jgi:Uma2 family endonuclease
VSALSKTLLTEEQYLELERKAEYKSEYYEGEIFAMSGASLAHVLLVGDVFGELREQLKSGPCTVLANDMRVRVSAKGLYTYPDVVVVCGEPQLLDDFADTLLNPTLIVEVLSPSTEAYDHGRKFEHYRSIESFKQYLLIASDRVHADLYTRQPENSWLLTSAERLEDSLELAAIGCRIGLRAIYARVKLPDPSTAISDTARRHPPAPKWD